MVESSPSITPHELLAIKDGLLEQWRRLPAEHQASMLLVLMNHVLQDDYGQWAADAIRLLAAPRESSSTAESAPRISPQDLVLHTGLTPPEIAQLSADDLRHISAAVVQHLAQDVFWDEIEYQAREQLDARR